MAGGHSQAADATQEHSGLGPLGTPIRHTPRNVPDRELPPQLARVNSRGNPSDGSDAGGPPGMARKGSFMDLKRQNSQVQHSPVPHSPAPFAGNRGRRAPMAMAAGNEEDTMSEASMATGHAVDAQDLSNHITVGGIVHVQVLGVPAVLFPRCANSQCVRRSDHRLLIFLCECSDH